MSQILQLLAPSIPSAPSSPLTERGIGVVLLDTTATGLHQATELLTSEQGMTNRSILTHPGRG